MKKKNIIFIIVMLFLTIGISISTSYAATTLFASSEVSYDNTTSGMSSTNVQTAIDELYTEANKYKGLDDRLDTLESEESPIGTYVYSAPDSVSITSGTLSYTNANVTLSAGTWIIMGTSKFASNATGYRITRLDNSDDCSSGVSVISATNHPAASGSNTTIGFQEFIDATSSKTYYLCAQQNSGSSLNVAGRIQAVRIK